MGKKKICWITGDAFMDTDQNVVPYLMKYSGMQIDWYQLSDFNSKVPAHPDVTCVFKFKNRGLNPLRILEYIKLFNAIDIRKYDIIYSGFMDVSYFFFVLKFFAGKIFIVHAAHNVIPYPVWSKRLRWYVNTVFKYNHHFQLFSKFTADYFRKKYPTKSMFYAPMTVKSFGEVVTDNYKVDSSKLNLLFFGNVVENKRLDLLIDAIKGLSQEIQDGIHLNICGNCKDAERFIQQIDGCSSISTYFKRIDDCEIAELFTKHDFLMLPYEDVAQSGPHMIAYYYNLPVIASDIEGFAERVIDGENGYLFKRNNLHDLVAVIKKASQLDNVEYVKMRNNLRTYTIQNYSVETVASKYIEYFKSL